MEFCIRFGDPQVDGRILIARHKPLVVRRPDERMDAVGIREFLLRDEIVRVPKAYAAKVRDSGASAGGLKCEGGNGFRRRVESVRDRAIGVEQTEPVWEILS